jgi:hypothetical protein
MRRRTRGRRTDGRIRRRRFNISRVLVLNKPPASGWLSLVAGEPPVREPVLSGASQRPMALDTTCTGVVTR